MKYNEKLEKFKKYQVYFDPVVVVDLDYKIIYKNSAAQHSYIKLQINNHINRILSAENMEKLHNTIETGAASVIDMNIPTTSNRCIANIDEVEELDEYGEIKHEKLIVFIFFSSINLAKNNGEHINSLLDLLELYTARMMVLKDSLNYGLHNLEDSFTQNKGSEEFMKQLRFVTANHQKIARLQNRLSSYINNIRNSPDEIDKLKSYCDISRFCENLRRELLKYLQNNGYNINFDMQDEIFIIKLYEKDFLLLNLIIIMFILKHTASNTINLKFFTETEKEINNGIIRYEFQIREELLEIFKIKYTSENLTEVWDIMDMDKLDLSLASIIAGNNDSMIDIKTDSDIKRVAIDIIIHGKHTNKLELKNFFASTFDFMSDQVQDMFAAEFSASIPEEEWPRSI